MLCRSELRIRFVMVTGWCYELSVSRTVATHLRSGRLSRSRSGDREPFAI